MNITVISVGKIKQDYLKLGIEDYANRIRKFANLNLIEVDDEKTKENASVAEIELILKAEAKRIIVALPKDSIIITFDLNSQLIDSKGFAEMISQKALYGTSHITFIIGGSLGIHQSIKQQAVNKICFGKVTYPHQLFKLIALEQIYRTFKINRNEPYHK